MKQPSNTIDKKVQKISKVIEKVAIDNQVKNIKKNKKKKKRCNICNKRLQLGITSICKCGLYFCSQHMLDHACTYDYAAEHKKKLYTEMPTIEFKKHDKI